VDTVGLALLVVSVGALQLMLDLGKEHDWFNSSMIVALTLVAAVGLVAFVMWEITEREPIVSLKVFRHRGFSTSMITLALTFGAFFATNVLTPLWLQTDMGYTATWSGYATAAIGVSAMIAAPIVGQLQPRVDPRKLVFAGVLWIAVIAFMRANATSEMTFWQVSFWVMLMGAGLPFFFLPLTSTALGSVEPQEVAAAAGLMNFIRTLAGAVGTSVVNTVWDDGITRNHAELAGVLNDASSAAATLAQSGLSDAQAIGMVDQMVTSQAVMLSTNHVFTMCGVALVIAACAIWLSPKPKHVADTSSVH
jgi:DHA2 family multidrug resistance protein